MDHRRQRIIKDLPMDNMTALATYSTTVTTITTSTGIKTGKLLVMEAVAVVPVASTKISNLNLWLEHTGQASLHEHCLGVGRGTKK